MQKFVIPQFIDVEAKIIGPVTVRQFIIMLVVFGLIFIFYKLFSFWTFLIVGLILLGIGVILAFLKVNGRPMHYFLLNIIETFKRPNLRIWNKQLKISDIKAELKSQPEEKLPPPIPKKRPVSFIHLKQLALIVDTGGIFKGHGQGLQLKGFQKKEVDISEFESLKLGLRSKK